MSTIEQSIGSRSSAAPATRFKDLIESRGRETDALRGEVPREC
jgi:hypothetical protein